MDRRSHGGPMDFTWTNGLGPVDESSPFATLARTGAQRRAEQQESQNGTVKKRPHSVFDSPTKFEPTSFREPTSQSFLFSQPSTERNKPLPRPPLGPQFTTPRKFEVEVSSGGETPDTPDISFADSEGTPGGIPMAFGAIKAKGGDARPRSPVKFKGSDDESAPKKSGRRDSWMNFRKLISSSPKSSSYSTKGERRIMKRRTKAADTEKKSLVRRRRHARDSEDSDDDANSQPTAPESKPGFGSSISSFFTYLESHPNLPHILSYYVQLALNIFIAFMFMRTLWSFWSGIMDDVNQRAESAKINILHEVSTCKKHYEENNCHVARTQALEPLCQNWKDCMNQDSDNVYRAKLSARMFAEIFNSLIEPISWKAMIFMILFAGSVILALNVAFSMFRNHYPPNNNTQHSFMPQHPSFPQTPHRYPSGGSFHDDHAYFTPYGTIGRTPSGEHGGLALEPGPSAIAGAQNQGSPGKRTWR
ncbi:hypothetical protein P152DRAFT_455762 [Eremomyces bilateralis CBS 781.70]|uniref:Brl1/Brr6 domain-containing protein n=1 Tax=Eremomyces bilateralis CBS 781.70 TaxID=1392243 RepID=A0A6G1G9M7_9PEZI|nr:uncharacterized protein P152DRAFT_455762 [Eremomyces bilateralis CBS 781.70]KAF1814724.1 hypothetical protein P152DRAFT_455762 [Eremomyces bilateralis CBS 781.70]